MANEESLIIKLDAQTRKLDAKLKATDKRLDELAGTTEKADGKLRKLSSVASAVGATVIKLGTAFVATTALVSAMTLKAASSRKELERFATQAKTTEENFQSLAFATEQYGINAEKIADISKDISDKVGEFSAAGTGTFQDYADVMKLTKDEARSLAAEFETMSSEQVIGKMVSEMEAANVSGDKMTFVLESMGNDLSLLKPLFADNAALLGTLKDRFDAVNGSLQITGNQAEALKEVSTSFSLLSSGMGNAATAISATLAPVLNDFINDIIEVVPDATQTIINFVNSFKAPEDINSITGLMVQIEESEAKILDYNEKINTERLRGKAYIREDRMEEEVRLQALRDQLDVLNKQNDARAERLAGGEIGGETGDSSTGSGTGDEIKAIEDRFKTETELLTEKLERELEIIGEDEALKIELKEEYYQKLIDMDDAAEAQIAANKSKRDSVALKEKQKLIRLEEKIEAQKFAALDSLSQTFIDSESDVGKALFLGTQALAFSETFVNTQAASIKALSIDPTGALSLKAEIAGGLAMASIAAATVSGLSGGSSSSGSSVSTTGIDTTTSTPDFEQETSSFDISDSTSSGSQTVNFVLPDGDELGEMFAKWMNGATRQGLV